MSNLHPALALLTRREGVLIATAPLDQCELCECVEICDCVGYGCIYHSAGDDPCDFDDPGKDDAPYHAVWGNEPRGDATEYACPYCGHTPCSRVHADCLSF